MQTKSGLAITHFLGILQSLLLKAHPFYRSSTSKTED
ncbi:hypothetical protein I3843_13G144100 [Carya illinoinensis]|nr:hypothetical protein I3843_13G144100 [Carya illinoinensis]